MANSKMKLTFSVIMMATAVAACAPIPDAETNIAVADPVSKLAEAYVKLSLEIGAQEDGYIDAYYGPAEWLPAKDALKRGRPELITNTRMLISQVSTMMTTTQSADGRRRLAFLAGQLRAAETRLLMASGQRFNFEDEAERLFGVRPVVKPLTTFDPIIADIEKLLPGTSPLPDRVDAAQNAMTIPTAKLKPVFDAAISECRTRTAKYIGMPPSENFTMEFVTGKSWSGYNYYQGNYRSLIQINTDLPIRLTRAVDLGCHEGYPGHHALNFLLEQNLSRGKGWREFTVYPLYSPQSLIAEGSANYGISLTFPGDQKLTFERDILAPLAGIDRALVSRNGRLQDAVKALAPARFTIAKMLLDGEIDREQAIALSQKYLLQSRARAEQSIRFTEQYRSYVINYGFGEDMVQRHVEQPVSGKPADAKQRWQRMIAVIGEPTIPADLAL